MAGRRTRAVTPEQALLNIARATLQKWLKDYAADPVNTENPSGPWFDLMCLGLGYEPAEIAKGLRKRMVRP